MTNSGKIAIALLLLSSMTARAQQMAMNASSLSAQEEAHESSGTDVEPTSIAVPMLMMMRSGWMLMLHGEAFVIEQQQSGARGADKSFSTNWMMPMASRDVGHGRLTLRTMISLEPATITGRYYPELFQQGETAFGRPIVDGQHPHDLFMEIAAIYDLSIGERTTLSIYAAPVGDPALGPAAYPHRASASEEPIAPLSHHLQDSTHIADDVVTIGATRGVARIEASGFHGREPGEDRWQIDQGKIDSWSTRLTLLPSKDWSAQVSYGKLAGPEALEPRTNIGRFTASAEYNRPLSDGSWTSLLVYGRNHNDPGFVWSSYLAESTLRLRKNAVWARVEDVDRTSELLFKDRIEPANLPEGVIGRVQAFTGGYDREVYQAAHLSFALGAQVTAYATPNALRAEYGAHPVGGLVFLRLRAK